MPKLFNFTEAKNKKTAAELHTYLSQVDTKELKNKRDEKGFTVLHHAVMEGNLEKVKLLTDATKIWYIPCNINHPSTNTLMHFAALSCPPNQDEKYIPIMLHLGSNAHGADRAFYNAKHQDGGLPIHSCAFSGALGIMKFLAGDARIPEAERNSYFAKTHRTDNLFTPLDLVKKGVLPNVNESLEKVTKAIADAANPVKNPQNNSSFFLQQWQNRQQQLQSQKTALTTMQGYLETLQESHEKMKVDSILNTPPGPKQ